MQHLGFIVLLLILLVIFAYAFTTSKMGDINFKGFLAPFRLATSTQTSGARQGGQSRTATTPSQTYIGTPAQRTIDPSEIPAGFTLKDLSPYFKKVSVSVSPGSAFSYSQISLYPNFGSSERVDVTGWSFRGNRGSLVIPQAVNVYDPSGLAAESDIYLHNGDTLRMYSTQSAIGKNLRLNECLGYFANSNVFNPPLPFSCPRINRSEIVNFSGQCQSYIMSLATCQPPAPNPPIPVNDYSCQPFLSKLNYKGCFDAHRFDDDFLGNQWWVWTGTQFLDFQHDRVLLFDKQGLLVWEYTY